MCITGTRVDHHPEFDLWVKREDLSCPKGPYFSKTRGVYAHIAARPKAKTIGVLDTAHSQGGWAVARACQLLGRRCMLYYPVRKAERGEPMKLQQRAALELGAGLTPLQAGRSAVLYHAAKKHLALSVEETGLFPGPSYMMPNALKLPEMIDETVAEVLQTPLPPVNCVIISASSGTIAAGVISGLTQLGYKGRIVVHQGYSRGENAIRNYMVNMVGEYSSRLFAAGEHPGGQLWREDYTLVDEGYSYADEAKPGTDPRWPCNKYYDLKAFRWWMNIGRKLYESALLWNIG